MYYKSEISSDISNKALYQFGSVITDIINKFKKWKINYLLLDIKINLTDFSKWFDVNKFLKWSGKKS